MILPRYRVADSLIPHAGKGLFADQRIARGAVVIAPDKIDRMIPRSTLDTLPKDSIENLSSVRWFEEMHTISVDWPDECYVNHSDSPNLLWHLGFNFALRDIAVGEELTLDYRLLLGSGESSGFADSVTGREVIGLSWDDNLRSSTTALARLLGL